MIRRATVTASAAALILFAQAGSPADAQSDVFAAVGGIWRQDDWQSIEIGPDTITYITPDGRWAVDPTTCYAYFEHVIEPLSRTDIIDFLGLNGDRPLYDFDERPMDERILAALPEVEGPMDTVWSYCAAETHGGTLYVLTGADTLTAIAMSEGYGELTRYSRQVPPPSHDRFSTYDRFEIQQQLVRMGHYIGAFEPEFGPLTEKAIRSYQRSIGADPTGVLSRSQFMGLLYGR